jgi:hypothetical protein
VRDDPIERRRQARRRGFLVRLAVLGTACVLVCVGVGVVAVAIIRRPAEPSAKLMTPALRPAEPIAKQMDPSPELAPPKSKPDRIRFYLAAENSADSKTFPQYRSKSAVVLHGGELSHQFQINELKAIHTYRGQRFYISGYTSDLSVSGETTTLTLGDVGFGAVYCKCSSRDALLLKVRAGFYYASSVLLEGTCGHATAFSDCRVVEVVSQLPPAPMPK